MPRAIQTLSDRSMLPPRHLTQSPTRFHRAFSAVQRRNTRTPTTYNHAYMRSSARSIATRRTDSRIYDSCRSDHNISPRRAADAFQHSVRTRLHLPGTVRARFAPVRGGRESRPHRDFIARNSTSAVPRTHPLDTSRRTCRTLPLHALRRSYNSTSVQEPPDDALAHSRALPHRTSSISRAQAPITLKPARPGRTERSPPRTHARPPLRAGLKIARKRVFHCMRGRLRLPTALLPRPRPRAP
ncbi:hypothetical protein K466DRAFT_400075 [Polyporus arcularius HHB13444]|uniref:Uncharacterized protein n=1 Tax=Polyporus arcularius HHB13444 TaxID=1314778 RepID=A0A5C3NVJ1_9APHY|nr:hypothetical protein K466DRAFT_400075 [Polyporus arcularius HHB13444]